LKLKVHFDPMIRWKRLDKINVHRIYNLQFFNRHKAHVYGSWNITKQNKIEEIMQCPFIKFPTIWYGNDFFLKRNIIMHWILNKCKKPYFWMEFHPKI
jgi:hypothetical protein